MSLSLDKSGWKRVAFRDVVNNVSEAVRDAGAIGIDRIIALEHLDPGALKVARWGSTGGGTTFTRRVKPGQTLFGKRRAYQRKVAYAEFDAICSGDIYTFEADESHLLGELLPFVVQSNEFFDHALDTSVGSLSPRTNWRELANFEFRLPPLDEQKRVVDLLWAIEAAQAGIVEVATEFATLTAAVFEAAADGCATVGLGSWVTRIDAGRSPRAANEPVDSEQVGVLKVSAVGRDVFVPSENKRLLDPDDFRPQDAVRAGDVLVTRANAVVGNVARPCMVERSYPNLMLSDKTLRLVPRNGIPNRVVLAALQSKRFRAYVKEVVNGTEAKNISQAKILAGPVPNIEIASISDLTVKLRALDEALLAARAEASRLLALRAALLADIFGGNDDSIR